MKKILQQKNQIECRKMLNGDYGACFGTDHFL